MNKTKLLPRPDNNYRTQEQAIPLHNGRGEIMLSVADLPVFVRENNTEAISGIRQDCEEWYLMTSTGIEYSATNLSATIIHHKGSTIVNQTEIFVKEVPVFDWTPLDKVLASAAGLDYAKALTSLTTKDEAADFFVKLTDKKPKDIIFWTPSQSSRANKQVRSVGLLFYGGRFRVGGDGWVGGEGLSRGVIVRSAKQTQFFSKGATFDLEENIVTIPMTRKLRKNIENIQRKKKKLKISWDFKVQLN